jgi:hypothetical protein
MERRYPPGPNELIFSSIDLAVGTTTVVQEIPNFGCLEIQLGCASVCLCSERKMDRLVICCSRKPSILPPGTLNSLSQRSERVDQGSTSLKNHIPSLKNHTSTSPHKMRRLPRPHKHQFTKQVGWVRSYGLSTSTSTVPPAVVWAPSPDYREAKGVIGNYADNQ